MTNRLDEPTYRHAQAALYGLFSQAEKGGADSLTLAHAFAPVAVEMLLNFHTAEVVGEVIAKQIELIASMQDAQQCQKH